MSNAITSRFFHWMEANNISRSDAAAALGVDDRSLSNYRSRGLPRRKHARAEQIMREHGDAQQLVQIGEQTRIAVPFTDDELALVQEAARIVGNIPIPEFIQRAATHKAKEEISKATAATSEENTHLRVAEDPTPYRVNEGKA